MRRRGWRMSRERQKKGREKCEIDYNNLPSLSPSIEFGESSVLPFEGFRLSSLENGYVMFISFLLLLSDISSQPPNLPFSPPFSVYNFTIHKNQIFVSFLEMYSESMTSLEGGMIVFIECLPAREEENEKKDLARNRKPTPPERYFRVIYFTSSYHNLSDKMPGAKCATLMITLMRGKARIVFDGTTKAKQKPKRGEIPFNAQCTFRLSSQSCSHFYCFNSEMQEGGGREEGERERD